MKHRSIQDTVIPQGYTGRNFNSWQKYLQAQIDKIKRTKVARKMVA